jgi:hypothetical protein
MTLRTTCPQSRQVITWPSSTRPIASTILSLYTAFELIARITTSPVELVRSTGIAVSGLELSRQQRMPPSVGHYCNASFV